jgi:two-component system alkaline phosphatase synthesis response regulator PhoP
MSQSNRRKKKILVVDDVPFVRVLVKRFLGKNYRVIEAGDGAEAVDMAQDQKPDLILMDIMMPKMDGYTSCYKIKSDPSTKAIPVVMLTAVGYELNVKLSKDMGADGYITKPFTSEDLHSAIDTLLTSPSISNGSQSSES